MIALPKDIASQSTAPAVPTSPQRPMKIIAENKWNNAFFLFMLKIPFR